MLVARQGPRRASVMNRVYGKRDMDHHRWGEGLHFAKTYIRVLTSLADVVLDCFARGGTFPAARILMGRHFLAAEIDTATAQAANERMRQIPPPLTEQESAQMVLA